MSEKHICPICDQGELQARTYSRVMQHKGVTISVDGLIADYCPECGTEIASPAQLDFNAKLIRDAFIIERERVKQAQHLLTGAEIRAAREQLGITQKQAAKLFGGGPSAFAKYEAEDVVQSAAMDKLIRLVVEVPAAADWLFKYAGLLKQSAPPQVTLEVDLGAFAKQGRTLNQQAILKDVFKPDDGVKSGKFIKWGDVAISTSNDQVYADAA